MILVFACVRCWMKLGDRYFTKPHVRQGRTWFCAHCKQPVRVGRWKLD